MRSNVALLCFALLVGVSLPNGFVLGQTIPFDFQASLDHVLVSFSSYCGTDVNASFDCYWCQKLKARSTFKFTGDFGNSENALFGFVGCLNSSIIEVAFRGTDNIAGWIKDADFAKVPFNGSATAEVHQGFWETYVSSINDVDALIQQARSAGCGSGKEVTVTGHSLGAALATIAAVELASRRPELHVRLVNFGSPRAGNEAFAQLADSVLKATMRFTHHRDIVPHLPALEMDYYHLATEYWQNNQGDYVKCNGSGEDPSCADSLHIFNPLDHATYLGLDALDGIIHNCLYTDP